jgi:hypothetical protein
MIKDRLIDAVANGDDGIEVVVFQLAFYLSLTL